MAIDVLFYSLDVTIGDGCDPRLKQVRPADVRSLSKNTLYNHINILEINTYCH